VPSSAIGSILESMPGSVLENVLGGVLGSVLGVYLRASSELTWERKSSRLGVYNQVQSGVYFRAYLGVCNEVHLTVFLNAA
jgi:hypothetical protein